MNATAKDNARLAAARALLSDESALATYTELQALFPAVKKLVKAMLAKYGLTFQHGMCTTKVTRFADIRSYYAWKGRQSRVDWNETVNAGNRTPIVMDFTEDGGMNNYLCNATAAVFELGSLDLKPFGSMSVRWDKRSGEVYLTYNGFPLTSDADVLLLGDTERLHMHKLLESLPTFLSNVAKRIK